MHRLASITPGATMAPVGQASMHRTHDPHPSGAGPGVGSYSAVVMMEPRTNQLPAPGNSRLAFLPYQPSPAR